MDADPVQAPWAQSADDDLAATGHVRARVPVVQAEAGRHGAWSSAAEVRLMPVVHAAVSVDIDRFSDFKLEHEWLPMFRKSKLASTVAELREVCRQARADGFEVFPSVACNGRHRKDGTCPGHPTEQEVRAVVGTRDLTEEEREVLDGAINVVCEQRKCECSGSVRECACVGGEALSRAQSPCRVCGAPRHAIWMDDGELVPRSVLEAMASQVMGKIKSALMAHTYRYESERDLQEGVARVLREIDGVIVRQEVNLTSKDRVDFLCGTRGKTPVRVGVEVKVAGPVAQVRRQLERYARSRGVDALLLVSPLRRHVIQVPTIEGVMVSTAFVGRLR